MTVTVFRCRPSRTGVIPRCSCGERAAFRCDYPLRGRKAGQLCRRTVCDNCRITTESGDFCRVHGEMQLAELAKLKGEPVPWLE